MGLAGLKINDEEMTVISEDERRLLWEHAKAEVAKWPRMDEETRRDVARLLWPPERETLPIPDPPAAESDPADVVMVRDGSCGEPVAFFREGDPAIGWVDGKPVTRWLSVREAKAKYGPVSEIVTGPGGGFRSALYGVTRFTDRHLDPRKGRAAR